MDPKQFTEKVTSLLNAAQQLAAEHSHQSLTPTHVAIVMFEDEGGVARAALAKQAAAGSDSLASVLRTLKKQLVRFECGGPAVWVGLGRGQQASGLPLYPALQMAWTQLRFT